MIDRLKQFVKLLIVGLLIFLFFPEMGENEQDD